jgi:predicted transposase YdaD
MTKTTKRHQGKEKDHDIFLRGIFGLKELVFKFLQYAIPEELKPFIDFDSLRMLPETYVSEKLHITHSDTIYEANLNTYVLSVDIRNDPKLPHFRFCFLHEFKSSKPNQPIDFQMDNYVKRIQQFDLKNNYSPSIVLPILLYHGKDKWEQKRLYDIFSKYLPQTILDYIAFPKYIIIDLQKMGDSQIEQAIGLGELRAAFLALKHAQDKTFFRKNLKKIFKFVKNSPASLLLSTYVEMLLEYTQRRSGLETEEFEKIFETKNKEIEMATQFKSIVEHWREKAYKEGKEEGKEEGIKEGIEKGIIVLIRSTTMSDKEIAEEMEISVSFVQRIRQVLKNKESNGKY